MRSDTPSDSLQTTIAKNVHSVMGGVVRDKVLEENGKLRMLYLTKPEVETGHCEEYLARFAKGEST